MNTRLLNTKTMIFCALFAALTAVFSQIVFALPFTPVPLNLATLSVAVAGALLGAKAGCISQLVYLLVGAAGLPVFTRMQGGVAVLVGPTGGYLIGYLVAAFLIGLLVQRSKRRYADYFLAIVVGFLALYAFGTAWYMVLTRAPLGAALLSCVLPFLPGDLLKVLAGGFLAKKLSRALRLTPGRPPEAPSV